MTQDGKTIPVFTSPPTGACAICTSYATSRGDRIRREIRRTKPASERLDAWMRFMAGVHARHLAHARAAMARVAHTTSSKETR